MAKPGPKPRPTPERFAALYNATDAGCWIWQGHINNKGYGTFGLNPTDTGNGWRTVYAHRYSYELHRGPIPPGLVIDHACDTPACVNPDHLRPLTHRQNILRSQAPHIVTHWTRVCCRGHDLSDPAIAYTRRDTGRVMCRECMRIRAAQRAGHHA